MNKYLNLTMEDIKIEFQDEAHILEITEKNFKLPKLMNHSNFDKKFCILKLTTY